MTHIILTLRGRKQRSFFVWLACAVLTAWVALAQTAFASQEQEKAEMNPSSVAKNDGQRTTDDGQRPNDQTAFTYQGQLKDANGPVSGAFDLQFTLYSAQMGGVQLGSIDIENLALTNGLFSVRLDFGRAAVEATESWLEVGVRPGGSSEPYTVLFPRQKLTPTPYAIFAQREQWSLIGVPVGFARDAVREAEVSLEENKASQVDGEASPLKPTNKAVASTKPSTPRASPQQDPVTGSGTRSKIPMWLDNTSLGDSPIGVLSGVNIDAALTVDPGDLSHDIAIFAFSSNAPGILGEGTTEFGVKGECASCAGVIGESQSGSGVDGRSSSGAGVVGSGNPGVKGDSSSSAGVVGSGNPGVHGISGSDIGVEGESTSGTGVKGTSGSGVGVHGDSMADNGVFGQSAMRIGVKGLSDSYVGVSGNTMSGWGVQGVSSSDRGVIGFSMSSVGVHGQSETGTGVAGLSNREVGVAGFSTDSFGIQGVSEKSIGMVGFGTDKPGVQGQSMSGIGVFGISERSFGVGGQSPTTGVGGVSDSGNGIGGVSKTGTGVFGGCEVEGCKAAVFSGNVVVAGLILGGVKAFRIDHPLDPANKYLHHVSVESPEMKNVYDGVAVLDHNGEAVVQLPEWFEALNQEFRYQLTCIGGFAPVYIAEKIKRNRFKIAGGTPGLEVSWQVTGIRQDAFALAHPILVEEDKPEAERGFYLYPKLFGQPQEEGILWRGHPHLLERLEKMSPEQPATVTRAQVEAARKAEPKK